MKLLIIEDNPKNSEVAIGAAKTYQEPVFSSVLHADNYEDGAAILGSKVDVALIDVYIPGPEAICQKVIDMLDKFEPDHEDAANFQKSLQAIKVGRHEEAPVGLLLGRMAQRAGVEFRFVSSLNHHAVKLEAPFEYMESNGWFLCDGWRGPHIRTGDELDAEYFLRVPESNKDQPEFWVNALDRLFGKSRTHN